MYVRWKARPLRRQGHRGEAPGRSLRAVLVASRWIDGRPRQVYIRHLGSIRERKLDAQPWRAAFWKSADAALASLAIPDHDRERIEAKIAERVPQPTVDGNDRRQDLYPGR